MHGLNDSLHLDREDFIEFSPHYSNLKASEVIYLIDNYLSQREVRKFKTKKEDLIEPVIYNCVLTLFSIKLSESDLEDWNKNIISHSKEYRMFGEWMLIPYKSFYKSYIGSLFLERITRLNKRNLSIIINIILSFLRINNETTWGNFYNNYHMHNYTFDTYEDSLKAFRTFLVWFDLQLSDLLLKIKGKDTENYFELQEFVKEMIEKLSGTIEIDNLPENYIELIKMYNPSFGNLFSEEAVEI